MAASVGIPQKDWRMSQQQIFNSLVEFFEDDDWHFQWMEGTPVLSMGFAGKNGKWVCYAQAREQQQQFVFYSVIPVNVPDERRTFVAEFITRANYGMIIGNFEMDYDDGEVRYKTSIDVEGAALTPPLIRQMVYANVLITDRYLPGMMSVIYGGKTALEAIDEIEDDEDSLPDDIDHDNIRDAFDLEYDDLEPDSQDDDDDEDPFADGGPRTNGKHPH
jgi:hypothetical protein